MNVDTIWSLFKKEAKNNYGPHQNKMYRSLFELIFHHSYKMSLLKNIRKATRFYCWQLRKNKENGIILHH